MNGSLKARLPAAHSSLMREPAQELSHEGASTSLDCQGYGSAFGLRPAKQERAKELPWPPHLTKPGSGWSAFMLVHCGSLCCGIQVKPGYGRISLDTARSFSWRSRPVAGQSALSKGAGLGRAKPLHFGRNPGRVGACLDGSRGPTTHQTVRKLHSSCRES